MVFLLVASIIVWLIWCCANNEEVDILRCPGGIIGLKEDVLELDSAGVLGVNILECEDTSMPRYMLSRLKRAQKRVNRVSH